MTTNNNDKEVDLSTAQPLSTQVAGHVFGEDKKNAGLLATNDGLVLKGVQAPPRGTRELEFYEKVFGADVTDPDTVAIRQFLPAYHGTAEVDGAKFLKIENISTNFKHACIADFKMGRVTFDPSADEAKKAEQKSKYPCAEAFGFQVTGMRIYKPTSGQFEQVDKKTCQQLTKESMLLEGLGRFFGYPESLRKDAISTLISKVRDIQTWFQTQKQYSFYGSSLLVVYEGQAEDCSSPHDTLDVRMIDFGHVFPVSTTDENYLFGIHQLLLQLQKLMDLES